MKTIKIILAVVTILYLQGCSPSIRGSILETFPEKIHIGKEGGVVIVKVFDEGTEKNVNFRLDGINVDGEKDTNGPYNNLKDGEDFTKGWITLRDFKGKSRNSYMEVVIGSNYNEKKRFGNIRISVMTGSKELYIEQD